MVTPTGGFRICLLGLASWVPEEAQVYHLGYNFVLAGIRHYPVASKTHFSIWGRMLGRSGRRVEIEHWTWCLLHGAILIVFL